MARYELSDRIALGGSAEVVRAWDTVLGRPVALRIPRDPAADITAFLASARVTATLQHPGIVAVYDAGRLEDGRPFMAMPEVEGRTLHEALADNPSRRRLVDVVLRAAEAVGYAHAKGVVHGDLSPANVLLGRHGEVLVIDWGAEGTGTPGFCPPEGGPPSPRGDVWALGSILAMVLGTRSDDPSWTDLADAAAEAMSTDPADRPADARVFARELAAHLDGARQRERALGLVNEADALLPRIAEHRSRESAQARDAARLRLDVAPGAPIASKRAMWLAEDRAAQERVEAGWLTDRRVELLGAALRHDPDLPDAHTRLAAHWQALHALAESEGDAMAPRYERLLRSHDRGDWRAWLAAKGSVRIRSEPDTDVRIDRFVERDRVLVPEQCLDTFDISSDVSLPLGSYVAVLTRGEHEVRWPFEIRRLEHADTVDPAGKARTLRFAEVPDGAVLVSPGWSWLGTADSTVRGAQPRRLAWGEAFLMQKFPVTNAAYLTFLDSLVDAGDVATALLHVPRHPGTPGAPGAPLFSQDAAGHFHPQPDAEGDVWELDWPVMMVSLDDACAYATWLSAKHGCSWRLPTEEEWERAARGADARIVPWGRHFDPAFCNMRQSGSRPLPAAVDTFPVDESVYGVRGLAGNSIDWTSTFFGEDENRRSCKGGAWSFIGRECRLDARWQINDTARRADLGFRLVSTDIHWSHR